MIHTSVLYRPCKFKYENGLFRVCVCVCVWGGGGGGGGSGWSVGVKYKTNVAYK